MFGPRIQTPTAVGGPEGEPASPPSFEAVQPQTSPTETVVATEPEWTAERMFDFFLGAYREGVQALEEEVTAPAMAPPSEDLAFDLKSAKITLTKIEANRDVAAEDGLEDALSSKLKVKKSDGTETVVQVPIMIPDSVIAKLKAKNPNGAAVLEQARLALSDRSDLVDPDVREAIIDQEYLDVVCIVHYSYKPYGAAGQEVVDQWAKEAREIAQMRVQEAKVIDVSKLPEALRQSVGGQAAAEAPQAPEALPAPEQSLFNHVLTAYQAGIDGLQRTVDENPTDKQSTWELRSARDALNKIGGSENLPQGLEIALTYGLGVHRADATETRMGLPVFDTMIAGLRKRAADAVPGTEAERKLSAQADLLEKANIGFWDRVSEADKQAGLGAAIHDREAGFVQAENPGMGWEEARQLAGDRLNKLQVLDPAKLEVTAREQLKAKAAVQPPPETRPANEFADLQQTAREIGAALFDLIGRNIAPFDLEVLQSTLMAAGVSPTDSLAPATILGAFQRIGTYLQDLPESGNEGVRLLVGGLRDRFNAVFTQEQQTRLTELAGQTNLIGVLKGEIMQMPKKFRRRVERARTVDDFLTILDQLAADVVITQARSPNRELPRGGEEALQVTGRLFGRLGLGEGVFNSQTGRFNFRAMAQRFGISNPSAEVIQNLESLEAEQITKKGKELKGRPWGTYIMLLFAIMMLAQGFLSEGVGGGQKRADQ